MRFLLASALVFFGFAQGSQCETGQIHFKSQHIYSGHGGELKPVITPELSDFIGEAMRNDMIPGLSLGVVHSGIAEFKSWGKRTEVGAIMTTDVRNRDLCKILFAQTTISQTLFYLASVSKAFLSTSMGILMDDFTHGRNQTALPPTLATFDWDSKVKDLLPDEWELMDEWASSKANVRDILSHRSGLPR